VSARRSVREYRLTPPTLSETPVLTATAHNNVKPRRDQDNPRLRYRLLAAATTQQGIEFSTNRPIYGIVLGQNGQRGDWVSDSAPLEL
jgi:hypothetical protein